MEVFPYPSPDLWIGDRQCVRSNLLFCFFFRSTMANPFLSQRSLTTMLTPGIGPLVDNFHTDEGTLSTWVLTATTFWTGIAAFFVVSAANVWGRRWLYVLSTLILAVMNLVAFLSKVRVHLIQSSSKHFSAYRTGGISCQPKCKHRLLTGNIAVAQSHSACLSSLGP